MDSETISDRLTVGPMASTSQYSSGYSSSASSIAAGALLIAASLVMAEGLHGQEYCDTDLLSKGRDLGVHGYSNRGDRCEGTYAKVVGGTELYIASFTETFEEFNALTTSPLMVSWAAPDGFRPRIRARGIRRDLFFQMDVAPDAAGDGYAWRTDVIRSIGLNRNDIGLVAWEEREIGPFTNDLYVPLRISQRSSVPGDGIYELVIYPNEELIEVFVTLGPVGEDGTVGALIRENRPLRAVFYPAERPVRIVLDDLEEAGIYEVRIRAVGPEGDLALDPFWIYHPGR